MDFFDITDNGIERIIGSGPAPHDTNGTTGDPVSPEPDGAPATDPSLELLFGAVRALVVLHVFRQLYPGTPLAAATADQDAEACFFADRMCILGAKQLTRLVLALALERASTEPASPAGPSGGTSEN